jgi:hypothetical protein
MEKGRLEYTLNHYLQVRRPRNFYRPSQEVHLALAYRPAYLGRRAAEASSGRIAQQL